MEYAFCITAATVCLAFLTNGRIGYVLGERWNLNTPTDFPWWYGFCAIVGATVFYFASHAAFDYYGLLGGVICMIASLPVSGLIWIFIVGGNKAIERILNSLMKRVE